MSKNGVSPLIATVLIIGFTVALAAIIITWGGRFVQQAQEDVDIRSKVSLACSRLNFKITKVECDDNGASSPVPIFKINTVSLSSNTDQDISGFKVRTTDANGDVFVTDKTESLNAFDDQVIMVYQDTLQGTVGNPVTSHIKVTTIEAIPKITLPGLSEEICQAAIEKYTITSSDIGCT